jgi:hypothetical protein
VLVDRSTVGPRLGRTTSLSSAARLLTSERSPYYLSHAWRFFRRHAPGRRVAPVMFHRYSTLVASVARNYWPGPAGISHSAST